MKAAAFVAESANATDLRANPLLLSLMCILYRGAGSLPGDRAGIYARCAELLLAQVGRAARAVPAGAGRTTSSSQPSRYLAWWLFTREDSRAETTEQRAASPRPPSSFTTGLRDARTRPGPRPGSSLSSAGAAMWVFSDAGTTADGEKLYAFTHRTFLEYFAAGYLAATVCDSPEELGR